jgi:Ca2+-binding RTX toxin-like protein
MSSKHDSLIVAITEAVSTAPPQDRMAAVIRAARAQGYILHITGQASVGLGASVPLTNGSAAIRMPLFVADNSGVRRDRIGVSVDAQWAEQTASLTIDTHGVSFESLQTVTGSNVSNLESRLGLPFDVAVLENDDKIVLGAGISLGSSPVRVDNNWNALAGGIDFAFSDISIAFIKENSFFDNEVVPNIIDLVNTFNDENPFSVDLNTITSNIRSHIGDENFDTNWRYNVLIELSKLVPGGSFSITAPPLFGGSGLSSTGVGTATIAVGLRADGDYYLRYQTNPLYGSAAANEGYTDITFVGFNKNGITKESSTIHYEYRQDQFGNTVYDEYKGVTTRNFNGLQDNSVLDGRKNPPDQTSLDEMIASLEEIYKANCFSAQTPILMADGSLKPISEVEVGDIVAGFNSAVEAGRGPLQPGKVVRRFRSKSFDIYRLGNNFVTAGHPILAEDGSFYLVEHFGQRQAVTASGELSEPEFEKVIVDDPMEMFNFEVEHFHTYVADGIRVHNYSMKIDGSNGYVSFDSQGNGIGIVYDSHGRTIQVIDYRPTENIATLTERHGDAFTQRVWDRLTGIDPDHSSSTLNGFNSLVSGKIPSTKEARNVILEFYSSDKNKYESIEGIGDIGRQVGSILGNRISDDPFLSIGTSAILSTLGENLAEFVGNGFDSNRHLDLDKHANVFDDIGSEFLANLKSAGIGAISSFLTAELVNALGLDGFASELANTAAGAVIGTIASNIAAGASIAKSSELFAGVNIGMVGIAAGSFLGNKLANEIHSWETVGGQIGAAVGSTVLLALDAKAFAWAVSTGNPYIIAAAVVFAVLDAFLGNLIGGLIGSLFGGTPRSGADSQWDASQQKFVVANVWSRKNGSKDAAKSIASAVSETYNSILAATGGTLINPYAVQSGSYGMRKKDFVYRPSGGGSDRGDITQRFSGQDAAQHLIGYGVYQGLSDPDFKIAGGDIYVKRALYNTFGMGGIDPLNFDTSILLGNIASAQSYEKYLQNSTVINALVSAEPNSVFAIETLLTLARADELGLTRRAASDWFGGFSFLLAEAGTNAAQVDFGFDYDPASGQISRLIGIGQYVLGDAIDIAGQTTIEGTAVAETIDLRSGSLADQRGYTVNGHLNNDIAATGADFTATTATLTFAAGDLRKTVDVALGADSLAEAAETFLGTLSNAPAMQIMGGEAVATVIDGAAALPTLVVGNSYAWEGDGYAVFRLSLSKAASQSVTVALALAGDRASGLGVDFGSAGASNIQVSADGVNWTNYSGGAPFAVGVKELFVRTAVIADNVANPAYVPGGTEPEYLNIEGNERFTLSANVTGGAAVLANGSQTVSGTATIVDGAGTEPLVWIDDVIVDEASGTARFTVSRSGTAAAATTVDFATSDRRVLNIDIAATVDGGDGNDTIYASDKGDNLFGGAGNDIVYGGRLDDWLLGGDGNDLLFAAGPAGGALGGDGNYLNGGAGDDVVTGAEGSDWLEGGDGNDTLVGGAGDDILAGGAGVDSAWGGEGADYYLFRRGDGADTAEDGLGDIGTADSLMNLIAAKNAGSVARDWAGGDIYSEQGARYTGNDRVVFGAGIGLADIQLKRSGTVSAPGMDLIVVVTQNGAVTGDQLTLKGWFDSFKRVEWLEFADGQAVRIGDFSSFVTGTPGNDVFYGTNGNDFVVGGEGRDFFSLAGGNDVGIGGAGEDEIGGDDGNDILIGGSDNDLILGGDGHDVLSGDAGDDRLNGGLGNDLLTGGRGNDFMAGGRGNDIFRISRGDGLDTIIDDYAGTWETVWTGAGWGLGYSYDQATNRILKNGSEVIFDGTKWIGEFNYNYVTSTGVGELIRLIPSANGQVGKDESTSDSDSLEFGLGINIQDLILRKDGNDLIVAISSENGNDTVFANVGDRITLKDWFVSTMANAPIERFLFAATGSVNMNWMATSLQGTDVNDTLGGTWTPDWITGGGGDDSIIGYGDNDILNGNAGQDTVEGHTGDDILYGGEGDDVLIGGPGKDVLSGGQGTDTASYITSGATIYAYLDAAAMNAGDALGDSYYSVENLIGGTAADHLGGDAGQNVLNGRNGNDVLLGGLGDDTYVYDTWMGSDTIQDGKFTIEEVVNASGVLGAGYTVEWTYIDVVNSSHQYRLIVRNGGGEVALDGYYNYTSLQSAAPAPSAWAPTDWKNGFGRVGSTVQVTREKLDASIDGGNDVLELGSGISLSDLSASWSGSDLVVSTSMGTITIKNQTVANQRIESLHFYDGLSANLLNLRLNANGQDGLDDLILGTGGNDTLSGLSGNDVISGGYGSDSFYGNDGDDVLEGGGHGDRLDGGVGVDTARYVRSASAVTVDLNLSTAQSGGDAAGDTLFGIENLVGSIAGNDVLTGNAGDNVLSGLDGNDTLSGGAGNDVLLGDLGDDNLSGGDGEDNIVGSDGNDTASGGNDKDIIDGGAGADTLHGDAGDDILVGGSENDLLYGDDGNDTLIGGEHDDTLWGGIGNDTLSGDAGNDLLQGEAGDDIYVFSAHSGADTIIDASGTNGIAFDGSVDWRNVWLARDGNNLRIGIVGGSSQITVSNFYAASGATTMRYIATPSYALYLAYAQPLIDQMSAISLGAPAAVPSAITSAQDDYWWAGGKASPIVSDIALTTNEDVASVPQGTGAIDHDQNITAYSIAANGSHGVATIDPATGVFTYLPSANYFGTDSFVVAVKDADGRQAQLTVNVTINPVNDAPTDISLALSVAAAAGVSENTTGIYVGDLSAADVDLPSDSDFGQSIFTSLDARFVVQGGNQLWLASGVTLDYEATPTVSVLVRATDRNGAGLSFDKSLTIAVADLTDIINGTAANDTLTGAAGVDHIYGLDGNDTIYGGGGNDLVDGGNGNDSLYGQDGDDVVTGGTGADTLDGGNGNDTLSGGSQDDILTGGSGNDVLHGDDNDDQLFGSAGQDSLYGDNGNDTLTGGTGADTLNGGAGTDIASYLWTDGGYATTAITLDMSNMAAATGDATGDTLTGIEGVWGTKLADTITGDANTNQLYGDEGADTLRGAAGDDSLYGQVGSDTLYGGAGNDTLDGGDGDDVIWGGDGNDVLLGGNGGDTLNAENGDDYLDGGAGNDILNGGSGNDTYVIVTNSGADTINNYHLNGSDNDLLGFQSGILDKDLWFQRVNDDLVISVIGTSTVTTVSNWFLSVSAQQAGSYQIKFIQAAAFRVINVDGLVSLMASVTKPADIAARDALFTGNVDFKTLWNTYWNSNPAPVLGAITNQAMTEDVARSLSVTATDMLDEVTAASPNSITLTVKVYDSTGQTEDYSLISSAISIGSPDANGARTVTLSPVANKNGQAVVKIWATDGGGVVSAPQVFTATVGAKADMPTITAQAGAALDGKGTFHGGATIPLNINPSFPDTDGSETQTILITGVPAGVSLNKGTYNAGTWTLAPSQLAGLALTGAASWSNDFTLNVQAKAVESSNSDTALTSTISVPVYVNAAPTDITLSGSIMENPAYGAGGVTVAAVDPDGGAFTYALTDASNRFQINSATGAITVKTATPSLIDYEVSASHSYSVSVTATDNGGLSFTKTINVPISDQNERPSLVQGSYSFSVAENSNSGTAVGQVSASDPDTYSATYGAKRYYFENAGGPSFASADGSRNLSQNTNDGRFHIDTATGQITVNGGLNYEAGSSYTYNVIVWDEINSTAGRMNIAPVTINLNDMNEAPTLNDWSNYIDEAPNGNYDPQQPLISLTKSDPDTDLTKKAFAFQIIGGNTNNFWRIDNNGNLYPSNSVVNYEDSSQAKTYNLTVRMWDQGMGGGLFDDASVNIVVRDVNESPIPTTTAFLRVTSGWPSISVIKWGDVSPNDPDTKPGFSGPFHYYVANVQRGTAATPTVWSDDPAAVSIDQTGHWFINENYTFTWVRFDIFVRDAANTLYSLSKAVHIDTSTTTFTSAPIVLDLDRDGIELTSLSSSTVRFDMDGDGDRDLTGWARADDGILAIDLNGNGLIDDGNEIAFQPKLDGAVSDLEGLRVYDSNGDNFITQADEQFANFRVWQDLNQDGVSDPSELRTLDEAGVASLSLTLTLTGNTPQQGSLENTIYGTSFFVRTDGSTGEVGDVVLSYMSDSAITTIFGAHRQAVAIDLGGDGISITDLRASSITFAMADDSLSVSTAWVGASDAMLVLDADVNGAIDNGAELSLGGDFGQSLLTNLDENGDGRVDAGDSGFATLRLWQDVNQDGISQTGELTTLGNAGVRALTVPDWSDPFILGTGESKVTNSFTVEYADGSTGSGSDVFLAHADQLAQAMASFAPGGGSGSASALSPPDNDPYQLTASAA